MTHPNVLSSDAGGRLPRARTALPRRSRAALAAASAVTVVLSACAATGSGPSQATLAGSATDAESTTPSSSADEPQIEPVPTDGMTPSGGPPWDAEVTEVCEAVVGGGLAQVAQSPDDAGTTTFWTKGRQWVACDVAVRAQVVEPAVLESARPGRTGFDARSLAVTMTVLPGPDGSPAAVRLVAGGRLPWRVDEIAYTFPDGHTEQATFVTSADDPEEVWWSVAYTPTEGVLVDPGTEPAALEPVTISIVGAAAEAFRLPWEDLQRSE
jgi:hypothetical protein